MTEDSLNRGREMLFEIEELREAVRRCEAPVERRGFGACMTFEASERVRAIALEDFKRQLAEKEKEFAAL